MEGHKLYLVLIFVLVGNVQVNCTKDIETNDDDIRIVGGVTASIYNLPFMATVTFNGIFICSAVIISPTWLLTTAKFIANIPDLSPPIDFMTKITLVPSVVEVRVGTKNRTIGGTKYRVNARKIHPLYNSSTLDYNIAALQVTLPMTYSQTIRNVPLPLANLTVPVGQNITLSGWGVISAADIGTGKFSRYLKSVSMPKISTVTCQSAYNVTAITPRMFCAKSTVAGKDACEGDEGGSAVAIINNKLYLVGLISWGKSCGDPSYPRVMTDIVNLRNWINTTTAV